MLCPLCNKPLPGTPFRHDGQDYCWPCGMKLAAGWRPSPVEPVAQEQRVDVHVHEQAADGLQDDDDVDDGEAIEARVIEEQAAQDRARFEAERAAAAARERQRAPRKYRGGASGKVRRRTWRDATCHYCSATYRAKSSPPPGGRPQFCSTSCRAAAARASLGLAVPRITNREPAELLPAATDKEVDAMRRAADPDYDKWRERNPTKF